MMTTAEFLEAVLAVLAGDARLSAWCMENFGREPLVCLDIDDRNPPAAEDYPLVAIIGVSERRGADSRHQVWELEMGYALVNEEVASSGNTRKCAGRLQVETLRELAENAVYKSALGITGSEGESVSLSDFPEFVCLSLLSVKIPVSNRKGFIKQL